MEKFVCKRCRYRFESGTNQEGKKCPYCGEGKVIREPSAEELLFEEDN